MAATKKPVNSATWTDDDFRTIFLFLQDIRVAMDDENCMRECKELLKSECREASRHLSRIADAVGAYS